MSAFLLSCANPQWHTAFELQPSVGCPGDWQATTIPDAGPGGTPLTVCGRGRRPGIYLSSAMLVEGWIYSKVRGTVTAREMGTSDQFRPEPPRGAAAIDDAYVDGL